jgi:Tol biopolymer transport system component
MKKFTILILFSLTLLGLPGCRYIQNAITPDIVPTTSIPTPSQSPLPPTPLLQLHPVLLDADTQCSFPIGSEILLLNWKIISLIDLNQGNICTLDNKLFTYLLLPQGASPVSPDGKWLAYDVQYIYDELSGVVVMNLTSGEKKLFSITGGISTLTWSGRESGHLITTDGSEKILDLDVVTGEYKVLGDYLSKRTLSTSVSMASERYIYFEDEFPADKINLFLADFSGKQTKQLTNDDLLKLWADFLPDGNEIVYFAFDRNKPPEEHILFCHFPLQQVHILNLTTGEDRFFEVKDVFVTSDRMHLSPDGTKIAIESPQANNGCAGDFPIYILDLETGQYESLGVSGSDVVWSPDGEKLAFFQGDINIENDDRVVIFDIASRNIVSTYWGDERVAYTIYWIKR